SPRANTPLLQAGEPGSVAPSLPLPALSIGQTVPVCEDAVAPTRAPASESENHARGRSASDRSPALRTREAAFRSDFARRTKRLSDRASCLWLPAERPAEAKSSRRGIGENAGCANRPPRPSGPARQFRSIAGRVARVWSDRCT